MGSSESGTIDMLMKAGVFGERDLRIPADLSMLAAAREWAERAAADFGLAQEDCFQVKLATSEAVTNAILHGSGSHRDEIELLAREERGALAFEVRDTGADPEPAGAQERLAEGGRGLELVTLVMDEVQLTRRSGGSVLRFVKRRAEAA